MIKFLIVVLLFVQLISCNEFFLALKCADVLDKYDNRRETEITLDAENYCDFMHYMQRFDERSRLVTDKFCERIKNKRFVGSYNLRNKIHGITCLQTHVNKFPESSEPRKTFENIYGN